MKLSKTMASKAKKLVDHTELMGVCGALRIASKRKIDTYDKPSSFWKRCSSPRSLFKWPLTREGDEKRRAFIDSLIGKDL